MSGYSEKPLMEKLGYEPAQTVALFEAPDWFIETAKRVGIIPTEQLPTTWAHAFFTSQTELMRWLNNHDLDNIEKGLWVSWPKKSSKVPTDLTEQTFRDVILPLQWVDTKVATIDETWSGLKFLRRKS